MKAYFAAGLREIAKATGYNSSTLNSLEKCSNFKRTHHFILQVWEALYISMLVTFIHSNNKQTFVDEVRELVLVGSEGNVAPLELISKVNEKVQENGMKELFFNYLSTQAEKDKTWQILKDFVFENCLAYVTLFLSIRGSNWHL